MVKGRKPTPTKLKILRGNPGCRPLNRQEPQIVGEMPPCPEQLDDLARTEWERAIVILRQSGIITPGDLAILTSYCAAFGMLLDTLEKLKTEGSIVIGAKGEPKQSPYFRMAESSAALVHKLAAELGLTPSSRSRLTVPPGESADEQFEAFLAGNT